LPCFAWLTQQVIARSKEKQKKSSEINNPIFELQVQGLPLRNNQGLFPFFDQLQSINSASTCLAQVEFTKQEKANVASHLVLAAALAFDATMPRTSFSTDNPSHVQTP
jgi:hypothetical protein